MPLTLSKTGDCELSKRILRRVHVATTTDESDKRQPPEAKHVADAANVSQLILLDCLMHLASVKDRANRLIDDLFAHLGEVGKRTDRLGRRLGRASDRLAQMPLPDSDSIVSAGSLRRYVKVKRHYCSVDAGLYSDDDGGANRSNLFTPSTRSALLQNAYRNACGQRKDTLTNDEHPRRTLASAMQTDTDDVFDEEHKVVPFSVDFCRPRPRRKSSFDAEQPLPTPEERSKKLVALCKPTTLEVDLPPDMLRRVSLKWKNHRNNESQRRIQVNRFDLVQETFAQPLGSCASGASLSPTTSGSATVGQDYQCSSLGRESSAKIRRPPPDRHTVDLFQCDAAKEYLYDFAPFYRRRSQRSVGGIKRFLSFRRVKRKQQPSPSSTTTPLHSADTSLYGHFGDKEKNDTGGHLKFSIDSIKRMLKKTLSFRSNNAKGGPLPKAIEQQLDAVEEVDQPEAEEQQPNEARRNLPISTSSQVMNVATLLRRHSRAKAHAVNGYATMQMNGAAGRGPVVRRRPDSVMSLDSQASINPAESKQMETYRTGYRINYPDECLTGVGNVSAPRVVASSVPSHAFVQARMHHVGQTSISPPYSPSARSNASSAVESNYSCDHEGYFTSMHHDSGLKFGNGLTRRVCRGSAAYATLHPRSRMEQLRLPVCPIVEELSVDSSPAAVWQLNRPCSNVIADKSLSPKEWASAVIGGVAGEAPVCSAASAAFPATISLHTLISKHDVTNGVTEMTTSSPDRSESGSESHASSKQSDHSSKSEEPHHFRLDGQRTVVEVPLPATPCGPRYAIVSPQVLPRPQLVYNNQRCVVNGCQPYWRQPALQEINNPPTFEQPKRLSTMEPLDQWLMAKFQVEEQEMKLKEARALEKAKLDALVDLQKRAVVS